jgi:superfamily II DNA or RNA helicase
MSDDDAALLGGIMSDDAAALLGAARDKIASAVLAGTTTVNCRLGSLTLRPHQRTAVARLLEIMARHRGALLADAVGLGKTYVALTIAREHARPLVICPAALRPMWERAMGTAALRFPVMSIESLARGERPAVDPDVIIVDEAHHLRTPSTRRYEAIASLAKRARLLLLSATPLHNSRRDLTAILALFLGSDVHAWSDRELARVIVRRDETSANQTLPPLIGPHALSPGADDDCLDAICALPAAVPAADEGTAAALAAISMVHLWASSRAALLASLRKRRARAVALTEAIASGQLPTSADLAAWHYADESLQLAFPFCVSGVEHPIDAIAVARTLDEYIRAVSGLIATCQRSPDPDEARASLLRTLRATHHGARIVAFSQYAWTVSALGQLLRAEPGVAVVTASGARIASGPVPRQEILAQFAGDAPPTPAVERVDLLLSTDLLSEGVDLRGASVVVHIDLPWNPARLEQRVGRARRLGSAHDAIHVYTFVPPAAAERMLALEQRLASKVRIAHGIVGAVAPSAFLRGEADDLPVDSPVAAAESLRAQLMDWLDPATRRESAETVVGAAIGPCVGWLAVVHVDGLPRLIHSVDGAIREDPATFARLADQLGPARSFNAEMGSAAIAQVDRWVASRQLAADIGVTPAYPSAKRAVLERLSQSVARAPRHRRPVVFAAAQRARIGISNVAGVGAERILAELARSVAEDEAWIHSVETFGALHTPTRSDVRSGQQASAVAALILFSPERTNEAPSA